MRRVLTGIFAAVLVLSVATTGVWAAGPGRGQNFVDQGGDGICDWYGQYSSSGGRYYVDEDGDGVCDNCASGLLCPREGSGRGFRGGRNR